MGRSCFMWLKIALILLLQKNHIFTSGASGTNAAVIRGALRAERPELLTVILPQSLKKQPPESQELLSKVRVQLFSHRSSFVALQNLSFTVSKNPFSPKMVDFVQPNSMLN